MSANLLQTKLKYKDVRYSPDFKGFFAIIEEGDIYSLCSQPTKYLSDATTSYTRICMPKKLVDKSIRINSFSKAIRVGGRRYRKNDNTIIHPKFINNKKLYQKLGCIEMEVGRAHLPIKYYIEEMCVWMRLQAITFGIHFVQQEINKRKDCKYGNEFYWNTILGKEPNYFEEESIKECYTPTKRTEYKNIIKEIVQVKVKYG